MAHKLNETLNALDACISELQTKIANFQESYPNYEIMANSSNFSRQDNAKTNLTFAFALNSLFY